MDIEKLVASSTNTFVEIKFIQEELKKLPRDYEPFLQLPENTGIQCKLSSNNIQLIPMLENKDRLTGDISIPDKSTCCNAIDRLYEGKYLGATFTYRNKDYMIFRSCGINIGS
jgi:hypothetical protein